MAHGVFQTYIYIKYLWKLLCNVPGLEMVGALSMHCDVVHNNFQQASKVLFVVSDKQFGQLISISPHSLTMLKTTDREFSFIKVWLTDQNNRPLEIENSVKITLIVEIR